MPKICFVLPSHWSAALGGAEFQSQELLRVLYSTGKYDIYFLARNIDASPDQKNHTVVHVGGPQILLKYGHFLDARKLLKQLRAIKPDIIYQRVGCAYTGIAAYYAKKNKCKLVWHVASTDDVTPANFSLMDALRQPHRFLEKKILEYGIRNIEEIVTQTEDQRRLLSRYYNKQAARLVRNFVEVPRSEDKSDLPVRVLWIGNLKPLKQPYVFIDLAKRLAVSGQIEFIMIGAALPNKSSQEHFERAVGEIEGLEYTGLLSQEQVNQKLATGHLLVNTSLYEGFSNTFIQAWMHCMPVISLNVNPDQLLSESFLGRFSGDFTTLIEDVKSLCSNSQVRTSMGLKARQFAIDNFSMRNAECLEAYLASLLALDEPTSTGDQACRG